MLSKQILLGTPSASNQSYQIPEAEIPEMLKAFYIARSASRSSFVDITKMHNLLFLELSYKKCCRIEAIFQNQL
jgi:hypothetical protein